MSREDEYSFYTYRVGTDVLAWFEAMTREVLPSKFSVHYLGLMQQSIFESLVFRLGCSDISVMDWLNVHEMESCDDEEYAEYPRQSKQPEFLRSLRIPHFSEGGRQADVVICDLPREELSGSPLRWTRKHALLLGPAAHPSHCDIFRWDRYQDALFGTLIKEPPNHYRHHRIDII